MPDLKKVSRELFGMIQAGTKCDELKDLGGWKSRQMVDRYARFATEHLLAHKKARYRRALNPVMTRLDRKSIHSVSLLLLLLTCLIRRDGRAPITRLISRA